MVDGGFPDHEAAKAGPQNLHWPMIVYMLNMIIYVNLYNNKLR